MKLKKLSGDRSLNLHKTLSLQAVETGFQSSLGVPNKVLHFPEGGDLPVSTSAYKK
jgi:hypothetical protein